MQVRQEALAKRYGNTKYCQPYQLAIDTCEVMMELRRWQWTELAEVIPHLTTVDVQVTISRHSSPPHYDTCSGFFEACASPGQCIWILAQSTMKRGCLLPSQVGVCLAGSSKQIVAS